MSKTHEQFDINEVLLEAHRRGQERAIDLSIRSGIPLVVWSRGKIVKTKSKYKYVLPPLSRC